MTATQDAAASVTEIGRDRRRKEDQRLITGRTRWTDNITLPGMLHLAMVRSPFAHATITAVDTTRRQGGHQRVAVFSGADLDDSIGVMINAWPITTDQVAPAHPPMATDRVTFAGEIVAVVVARTAAEARDAAELVDVDYEELPAALDLKESAEDKVLAHPDLGTNKSALWVFDSAEAGTGGNVEDAISKARGDGIVIEREYRQQRLIPAFMEPRSVVVDPTGEQLTMWTSTQVPHIVRFALAATTGVPESKIRVIAPDVGGGFGGKLAVQPEEWVAWWVARQVHKPVKYTETRSESLMAGHHGRDQWQKLTLAAEKDGTRDRAQGRAAGRPRLLRLARGWRHPGAGCLHVQRDLQVPGLPLRRPDGPDQQDVDRRLSRRRPAGGDVRHRTPDGRARRRAGRRPAGDPGEELDQARGVPVHHGRRAGVRLRQLRGGHGQGQGALRVRRAARRAATAPRRPTTRSSSASASRRSPRCAGLRRAGCWAS